MAWDQCLFQMDTQSELSGFSARSQPTLTPFSVHCSLFTFYCSRGTITVPRSLRPRVRPRHDRAILASPPSAAFDERGPKHDPAARAAAACSPDRKVREVEARGRAISSAGTTGKGETIGDPILSPDQWPCRTANGDIQFLSVSWALPLFRRRWRGFPCLSKKSGHPGLSARAACLGRWRGRAAGASGEWGHPVSLRVMGSAPFPSPLSRLSLSLKKYPATRASRPGLHASAAGAAGPRE